MLNTDVPAMERVLDFMALTKLTRRHDMCSVEMNCLWKNNKAHCIVCFIRPADESAPQRSSIPAGGAQMPDVQVAFVFLS